MSINFDQFKTDEDNVLRIDHTFNQEEVTELLEYLGSHPEINTLDLSYSENDDQLLQSLKNCNNLTSLNLSGCQNITDEGLGHLSKLTNLTSLDLSECNITDKGLEHLSKLINLTSLDLSRCYEITIDSIAKIASTHPDLALTSNYDEFFEEVCEVEKIQKSSNDLELKQAVKEMVFNLAWEGQDYEKIKYILNNPEKYPFLVNSKDEDNHDLTHFYTHSPEMQKFLFEKGMIPAPEVDQDNAARDVARDNQSVHLSAVTKRINFFTKELMQPAKGDYKKLAESYKDEVLELFNKNSLKIDLLDLTEQEKRSVMEKTLPEGASVPSDQDFIKTVTDKASKVLNGKYLRKNAKGEYDGEGYPTAPMQYDWTPDAKTTIPESIGLILNIAEKIKPNLMQMQELTATLITKHPKLLEGQDKLLKDLHIDKEKLSDKTKIHESLKSLDEDQVKGLFEKISNENIEEVYKEQQKFKLAKQLYVAATTYGNDDPACIPGTWV